ncbi:MAG: VanW family protein [Coriobacteriales bacterium]|jgi:CDP-diacylglycerol--glycerol-3-phosphate 3-phosphatidyltransferase|nr:VanW family protein [Coriobacteriales bacterium]
MTNAPSTKVLTVPNLLTFIRLLLLPVAFILLVNYQNNILACIIFAVAACTDFVDGKVARATNSVSRLGTQFDPLIDRLLIITGVVAVLLVGRIPLWILIVLLSRDALMLVLTAYMRLRLHRPFKVIFLGKLTTAVVMAGFVMLILDWPEVPGIGLVDFSWLPGWGATGTLLGIWFLYVGMIISWICALIYIWKGMHMKPRSALEDRRVGKDRRRQERRYSGVDRRSGLDRRAAARGADVSVPLTKGEIAGGVFIALAICAMAAVCIWSSATKWNELHMGYDDAMALATTQTQNETAMPVTLTYGDSSWELDQPTLVSWVSDDASQLDTGGWVVTPYIDSAKLQAGLHDVTGDVGIDAPAQDASFKVDGGNVDIVPSVEGNTGNYDECANDLTNVIFGNSELGIKPITDASDRVVDFTTTPVDPSLTTDEAQGYGIVGEIATFTTNYSSASSAKVTNIHLASDKVNGSLIAPGGTWSFNDTVGNTTTAEGYQQSIGIANGEYVDDIGGGVCQVATTIFNAAFNSGLPIVERTAHTLYIASYPAGRDAAVSYPNVDLKFGNDTPNWVMLTMSYDSSSVTATLWGTDPGYSVDVSVGDWQAGDHYQTKQEPDADLPVGTTKVKTQGIDGRIITVNRKVYDSNGNVIRDKDFKSTYQPQDEVVQVGTKPAS